MAVILPVARQQFCDGNGMPLSGGSVTWATPGTGGLTLRPVYADEAETIPLINPTPLDASGITFSGGSQVSVWGFGQYEQFVRDSQGNLIYSATLDTPGGLTGGTIQGSVQINGDLSVVGNITDTQSLSTPTIIGTNATFGGNVSVGSQVSANVVVANQLTSNGNLNVAGSEGIVGNSTIDGELLAGAIQSTSGNFTNLTAGNLVVGALTVGGVVFPKVQSGNFSTDGNNTESYTVNFPAAFNTISSVSLTAGATTAGTFPDPTPVVGGVSATSLNVIDVMAAGEGPIPGVPTYSIFWVVFGT